jgi:hypothetical protein
LDEVTIGVSRAAVMVLRLFGTAIPWIPHQSSAHGIVSALTVVPMVAAFATPRPPAVVMPPVVAVVLSVVLAKAAPEAE